VFERLERLVADNEVRAKLLIWFWLISLGVAGISQAKPELLDPATYPAFRKILASVALTFFAFLGFGVIAWRAFAPP